MTVSLDARTPSATVHDLSGSTPPGAGAKMQPFGVATAAVYEMPDTFASLGAIASGVVDGLSARRAAAAHPDAAVIDLAGRVKELNRREDRLVLRVVNIEDTVLKAMPPRPEKAEGSLRIVANHSVAQDGTRVTTIREPAGWAAETKANRKTYEAALAERDRHEQDEEARRGLPFWNKLRERAVARLERWGLQLAAMEPTTHAGLAAKATASAAVAEGNELPDGWRQALAVSLSRDAVRILSAEVAAPARHEATDPFSGYHAEIMGLQSIIETTDERSPEQEAAWARWKELDDIILASRPTTLAGAIGALLVAQREHHQFSIEGHQEDEIGPDDRLVDHLLTSALAVLQPLADQRALPQANIRPAPLPSGVLTGRYPAGTSREEVETYRTFLDMELRYLNWEIYGRTDGRLHYWLDNPAARMHGGNEPPASSRAAAVLGLLGLTPVPGVDGRAQAEGLARAASAA